MSAGDGGAPDSPSAGDGGHGGPDSLKVPRPFTHEDLDLVDFDDLVQALGRRFEEFILAGTRYLNVEKKTEDYKLRIMNMNFRSLGLSRYLSDAIAATIAQQTGPGHEA